MAQEYSGEELAATVLSGLQADQLFSRTTEEGTDSYLTDRLGSVIALAEESGEVATTYSYEPFGAPSSAGDPSENPFQFTGRENDGTGLQYNRARYYSPSLARFISQDPAGFEGSGPNLYGYVGGNPLDFTDPSGRCFPACMPSFNPMGPLEDLVDDATDQVGDWASDAPGVISSAWAAADDYVMACLGEGAWGALLGAGSGALTAGTTAPAGAVVGGITGCGQGLVEQTLRDTGHDTAAELWNMGTAAKDIVRAGKDVHREIPELPRLAKETWHVFF